MKILRLTLHNLASLAGMHTIDFEREPLRSTGLFSISGPTGSGKSTLLDGLCLALYENTPRLTAASGTKLPDVAGEEITQKAPANLLRRGAADGFAEVAFVGVDAETYTARWSVRRAHQRVDGALQKTDLALYRGNVRDGKGSPVEGVRTKPEVLDAIVQKVGLSFEQFTRAVLLAQNDFATFLKAEDRQRAEILQALTGTERFEAISRAVYERDKKERGDIEALEASAQGQLPLPAEDRAKAEAALLAASAALEGAKETVATRAGHLGWFKRDRELAEQLQTARNELGRATQAVADSAARRAELRETEELSGEARSLHDAEKVAARQQTEAARAVTEAARRAEALRGKVSTVQLAHQQAQAAEAAARQKLADAAEALTRARALDAQLEPAQARTNEKQRDRAAAEQAHQEQVKRRAQLDQALVERKQQEGALQEQRQPIAWIAPVRADFSAWSQRLNATIALGEDVARSLRDQVAKQATETKVAAAVETARGEWTKLQAGLQVKERARTEAEQAVKAFDPEALAEDRNRLDQRLKTLTTARTALAAVDDLGRRTETVTAGVRQLQQQIVDVGEQARAHRAELPTREGRLQGCRASRLLVEATIAEQTQLLREKLRPTEPCPVCGSIEHPYGTHAPDVADTALARLRQEEQEAERRLNELRQQLAGADASLGLWQKQEQAKTAELPPLQDQLAAAKLQLMDACARLELGALPDAERVGALARVEMEMEAARTTLAEAERRHRAATKTLTEATKGLDVAREAVAAAARQVGTRENALATAKAELEAAKNAVARDELARRAAEEPLQGLFAVLDPAVVARYEEEPKTFAAEFSAAGEALRKIDAELVQLGAETVKLTIERDEVAKAEGTAREHFQTRRQEELAAAAVLEALRKERAKLLGDRPADLVERELNQSVKTARARLDETAVALGEGEKAAAGSAAACKEAENRAARVAAQLKTAREALDRWLADYAQRSGRVVDRTRLVELLDRGVAWLEAQRAAFAALDRAVSTAQGGVTVHEQQLADHAKGRCTAEDEPTVTAAWETARRQLDETEKARLQAATFVANDDHRKKEHALLEVQITTRRKAAEPWFTLNELIGSADGAKFRGIVQGRTLDLLLTYANAQLELLSSRYRLERLRSSLNLIVVDRDMADERRSVHSLSGGESFLVSLALALGLASLTSNRIRIESLFIDEGFGSLDPATLNTAMNALMHLEAQGRKVGVISHVIEMADAIPVQIKIIKTGSGAARVVVPGVAGGEGASMGEPVKETVRAVLRAETVARMLAILERGGRISKVALRREIGCTAEDLDLACESLRDRIQTEGRSLRLR